MSRMIDLIRVSALPSNLMQSASKGSLTVPPQEMIEILVHLARITKYLASRRKSHWRAGMRMRREPQPAIHYFEGCAELHHFPREPAAGSAAGVAGKPIGFAGCDPRARSACRAVKSSN